MKAKTILMRLLLALLTLMSVRGIAAAEPHDCSWVKHLERFVSQQTANVGPPGHQLAFHQRLDGFDKHAIADFVGGQNWVYNVSDDTKGTGSHSGWYEWIGKGGDKLFGSYRGTHVTEGSVTTWRGTANIIGGTGRYANATGSADYKGRATPDNPLDESGTCTVNY